jgi:hypothetical protein
MIGEEAVEAAEDKMGRYYRSPELDLTHQPKDRIVPADEAEYNNVQRKPTVCMYVCVYMYMYMRHTLCMCVQHMQTVTDTHSTHVAHFSGVVRLGFIDTQYLTVCLCGFLQLLAPVCVAARAVLWL